MQFYVFFPFSITFFWWWCCPDEEASRPSSFLGNGKIMQPSNKLPSVTSQHHIWTLDGKVKQALWVGADSWSWAEAKVHSCESKAKLSWVFFSSIDILRSDKKPLGGQTPNPPSCLPSTHPSILGQYQRYINGFGLEVDMRLINRKTGMPCLPEIFLFSRLESFRKGEFCARKFAHGKKFHT